jgi:hypothetical protein
MKKCHYLVFTKKYKNWLGLEGDGPKFHLCRSSGALGIQVFRFSINIILLRSIIQNPKKKFSAFLFNNFHP